MAEVVLKDLVNLERLSYYDTKIKQWVVNMVSTTDGNGGVNFNKKDELPSVGQENMLYIVEDDILKWDGTQYTSMFSGSSQDLGNWGSF